MQEVQAFADGEQPQEEQVSDGQQLGALLTRGFPRAVEGALQDQR